MRKLFIISSAVIAAMMSLTSCNSSKTEPEIPDIPKEQVIGDWHFLSGQLMSVVEFTTETIYHIDLSLKDAGAGTLTVWHELDSESITTKSTDIKWSLEKNKISITVSGKEQTFVVSIGDSGNLILTDPYNKPAEYQKQQFNNIQEKLMKWIWCSPDNSKFREKKSYILSLETESKLYFDIYDVKKKNHTSYTLMYEIKDDNIKVWFNKEKGVLQYDWTVRFINESFVGIDNMILGW